MSQHNLDSVNYYKYLFTVFTPTYNRAHTLPRVYESLLSQTYRDFEWVIVDDGSSDMTQAIVESWQRDNCFPIHYIYQENQGKHFASNRGVIQAQGEFFLTLDSDDSCIPEALAQFKYHWDSILIDNRSDFSGVTCLCLDENGQIVGTEFPSDPTDSDFLEISYRLGLSGEKWGFHRTSVMREFPFPEVGGCSYVPENIVWSAVSRKYKTRFVNDPLRIYWVSKDGLTNKDERVRMLFKNSRAHALEHQTILNNELDFFLSAPKKFLRSAINFSRFSFLADCSIWKQFNLIQNFGGKSLWLVCLPAGSLAYLRDLIRFNALNSSK